MENNKDSQDQARASAAEEVRRQDFIDLQNEFSGLVTGRTERFLNRETKDTRNGAKKKAKRQAEQLTRLQQLLISNTVYATLYNDTMDLLRDAESRAEQEIKRLTEILTEAQSELNAILDNAAQLRSGVKVFKDKDGRVWTEHNKEVTGEALNEIVWTGNERSREDFLTYRHLVQETSPALVAWQTYQVDVLGTVRHELTNESQAASMERMQDLQSIMHDQVPDMSASRTNELPDYKTEQLKQPSTEQILKF